MAGYLTVNDDRTLTAAGVEVVAKDFPRRSEIVGPTAPPPPQPPTAPAISGWAYGDSWTGPTYGTAAWPTLLRDYMFLYTMYNRGVAGSRIQNVAVHAQAPGSAPWSPGNHGMVVVGALLNNQADADDSNNRDTAYESMRALVARFSSSAIREDTDAATFTYNGTWQTFTDPMPSGGTARYVNPTLAADAVHSGTVTVNVPAGVNYLQFIGLAPEMGTGATFTLHNAGGAEVARARTDARSRTTLGQGLGEGKRAPVVLRVPGTAGGTFTLKVTTPPGYAGAVLGYVDCLITLAAQPPMVVLLKPVHVLHPSYQKTALETYLRTIPDTMAAEFSNVVVADPNLGFDPATMLGADLLHPIDPGHKHVTAAIRDAINATAVRRALILNTPGLVS
jgi:hypothetical protein